MSATTATTRRRVCSVDFPAVFVDKRRCSSVDHDLLPLLNRFVENGEAKFDSRVRLSADEGLQLFDSIDAVVPVINVPLSRIQKLTPFGIRFVAVYVRQALNHAGDGGQLECVAYRLRSDDELATLVDCYRLFTGKLTYLLPDAADVMLPEVGVAWTPAVVAVDDCVDGGVTSGSRSRRGRSHVDTRVSDVMPNVTSSDVTSSILNPLSSSSSQLLPIAGVHRPSAASTTADSHVRADHFQAFTNAFSGKTATLRSLMDVNNDLLSRLRDCCVIGSAICTEIKNVKQNPESRVDLLLDALQKRPDEDFPKFIEALRATNQGRIADLLTANTKPLTPQQKGRSSGGDTQQQQQQQRRQQCLTGATPVTQLEDVTRNMGEADTMLPEDRRRSNDSGGCGKYGSMDTLVSSQTSDGGGGGCGARMGQRVAFIPDPEVDNRGHQTARERQTRRQPHQEQPFAGTDDRCRCCCLRCLFCCCNELRPM